MVNFNFKGKYVVVVGGGREGYRKTLKFLDADSKILVASKDFSEDVKKLHKQGKIDVLKVNVENGKSFIQSLHPKPDLLIAATDDENLNRQLAQHGKSAGCMVYAVNDQSVSDFIFPAIAQVEDVKIAISTQGQSPAMAKILRKRVEGMINRQDLLQIKLQRYVRTKLKKQIPDQEVRRKVLYKILEDDRIKDLLKGEKLDKAQKTALDISEGFSVNTPTSQEK